MKVLYNCRFGGFPGNSGIPQDTRLLAKTLSSISGIDVGLFFHPSYSSAMLDRFHASDPDLALSLLINGAGDATPNPRRKKPIDLFKEKLPWTKYETPTYQVAQAKNPDLADAVWRRFFKTSLSPSDRAHISALPRYISSIPDQLMMTGATWQHREHPKLETKGFDFYVSQDARLVQVSPGTKKIIRYHDPLPLIASDTFEGEWWPDYHYNVNRRVGKDSYYVCNSQTTLDQLLNFVPYLDGRAFVIPYTLPTLTTWKGATLNIRDIVARRRSAASLMASRSSDDSKNTAFLPEPRADFDYIIMVSTLEPRKNFIGAIQAFKILSARHPEKSLKFIIIGRPGWKFEETLRAMSSDVAAGNIIHLMDVDFSELMYLYKEARALLFPSFGEGFGFTPMEALQCGTPSVVSNLPVHHWVMGDSVLYADHYDLEDVADQLDRLLYSDQAENIRQELLSHAPGVLSRYSLETTRDQWGALFERLRREGN